MGDVSATTTENFLFFAAVFKNTSTVLDLPIVIMISLNYKILVRVYLNNLLDIIIISTRT